MVLERAGDGMAKGGKQMTPDLLTTADAATLLGLSLRRTQHLVRSGRLKARRVGPIYLLAKADVIAYKPMPQGWPAGRKRGPRKGKK
jgi:excisionase family DNA binding protein